VKQYRDKPQPKLISKSAAYCVIILYMYVPYSFEFESIISSSHITVLVIFKIMFFTQYSRAVSKINIYLSEYSYILYEITISAPL